MRSAIILLIMVLGFSCGGNDISGGEAAGQEYEPGMIYGRVSGLPGRKILLYSLYGDEVILIDSVMARPEGTFEFVFTEERERGLYRLAMGQGTLPGYYEQHRQHMDLIWDGSTVAFTTHYAAPADSMTILQSEENRIYYSYLRRMDHLNQQIAALNGALLNYPQDDNFYRRLERQHRRVQNRRANYIENLVKRNRGTIVSSIAHFQKLPRMKTPGIDNNLDELKRNFFCEGQFGDPLLLHTDLIPRRVIRYLSLYTGGVPDEDEQQEELITAVDVIMENAIANEEVYYFVLEYLINGFNSMDMDLVVEHLSSRYMLGEVCFEEGRLLDQEPPDAATRLREGDRVPGFSFTALDGREVSLQDIDAEYTLILFWGSWCPYCVNIMDDLYEVYSRFRDERKGFLEVVAIGIENNRQEWLDEIERGGYDWINYSSLERWDCPVARQYNIPGTPSMILLDKDKRYIQEPYRIRALNRWLSRRLD